MCGIVGLLVKNESLRPRLGELMVPMLIGMTERGPDSSGMAVFGSPVADGQRKISLYCQAGDFDWKNLNATLTRQFAGVAFEVRVNHAVLTTTSPPAEVRAFLSASFPSVHVLSVGRSIDLYKDVGLPSDVAKRYDFMHATGTHLVGHTRMATESAVTAGERSPVHRRRGLVPGAQRLTRQSRHASSQAREARQPLRK